MRRKKVCFVGYGSTEYSRNSEASALSYYADAIRAALKQTGLEMLLWPGICIVHQAFSETELLKLKAEHPGAPVAAHPECPPHIIDHADMVGSTSAILKFAIESPANASSEAARSGQCRPASCPESAARCARSAALRSCSARARRPDRCRNRALARGDARGRERRMSSSSARAAPSFPDARKTCTRNAAYEPTWPRRPGPSNRSSTYSRGKGSNGGSAVCANAS